MSSADMNFIPKLSLRDPASGRVTDLTCLFRCIYEFWLHRGLWGALQAQIVVAMNTLLLWIAAFTLSFCVNWKAIAWCVGETCGSIKIFHDAPELHNLESEKAIFAVCFLLACAASVAWEAKKIVETYCLMGEIHSYVQPVINVGERTPLHRFYYRYLSRCSVHQSSAVAAPLLSALGRGDSSSGTYGSAPTAGGVAAASPPASAVDSKQQQQQPAPSSYVYQDGQPKLETMSWDQYLHVVCRELLSRDKGINNCKLVDEFRVMQTLLVNENYLIALHGHHFFRRGSVLWWADDSVVKELLNSHFEHNRLLSEKVATERVQRRLLIGTVCSFVFYPLIASFFLVKLLVRHVTEVKNNPHHLMEYEWINEARWRFRLYNEPTFVFESRMATARPLLNDIMSDTGPERPIYRFFHRAAEITVFSIIVIGFVNASVVTFSSIHGNAIVWWLTIALLVYSASGYDPHSRDTPHRTPRYDQVRRALYYEDVSWCASTLSFRENIKRHFLWPRVVVLLRNVASVLCMPLMLLWLLKKGTRELSAMADFLNEITVYVDGIGSVCAMATFDGLAQPNGGAAGSGGFSTMRRGDSDAALADRFSYTSAQSGTYEHEHGQHHFSDIKSATELVQLKTPRNSRDALDHMQPSPTVIQMNSFRQGDENLQFIPGGPGPTGASARGAGGARSGSAIVDMDLALGVDPCYVYAVSADHVPYDVILRKRELSVAAFAGSHGLWMAHMLSTSPNLSLVRLLESVKQEIQLRDPSAVANAMRGLSASNTIPRSDIELYYRQSTLSGDFMNSHYHQQQAAPQDAGSQQQQQTAYYSPRQATASSAPVEASSLTVWNQRLAVEAYAQVFSKRNAAAAAAAAAQQSANLKNDHRGGAAAAAAAVPPASSSTPQTVGRPDEAAVLDSLVDHFEQQQLETEQQTHESRQNETETHSGQLRESASIAINDGSDNDSFVDSD